MTPVIGRTPPASNQTKSATVTLTGTLKKVAVEGGCYQLVANDGKNYELLGKFPKQDGTKLQVTGTVATDIVTLCQVGQAFKIQSLKVIKNKK
jgi:ribosomal protein S4E